MIRLGASLPGGRAVDRTDGMRLLERVAAWLNKIGKVGTFDLSANDAPFYRSCKVRYLWKMLLLITLTAEEIGSEYVEAGG